MKISVLIPTHNRVESLQKAIKSVLDQSIEDFECLVIDDHSTDSTKEVVLAWQEKDSRVNYFSYSDTRNLQAVLNYGLKRARGEYIARIDDDDIWLEKDKLKNQMTFLQQHPDYLLVGTNASFATKNGQVVFSSNMPQTDLDLRRKALLQNHFLSSTVLFRKDPALNLGGFPIDVRLAGDYGLWLALGSVGKFVNLAECSTLITLPEVWVKQRRIIRIKDGIKIIHKFKKQYPKYFSGLFGRYFSLAMLILLPQSAIFDRLLYRIKTNIFG
jgi:glycosyltransferase involved in cell wall biosynthesis